MRAYERRFSKRKDELEWLYMELYHDRDKLSGLEQAMAAAYAARNRSL